jgi:hypothetical protein
MQTEEQKPNALASFCLNSAFLITFLIKVLKNQKYNHLSFNSHKRVIMYNPCIEIFLDGMTPLDFQERISSEELQELMKMHTLRTFTNEEPNPWTWQVWTRIQREKDDRFRLISINQAHSHGHHRNHQHHGHSHSHKHDEPCESDKKNVNEHNLNSTETSQQEEEIQSTPNCIVI